MARIGLGLGIGAGLGLAGLGLAAWYLLEPKKGAVRRKQIVEGAKDIYDSASTEIKKMGETVVDGVSSTVDRIGDLTGLSKSASSSSTSSSTSHAHKSNGNTKHRASLAE